MDEKTDQSPQGKLFSASDFAALVNCHMLAGKAHQDKDEDTPVIVERCG